MDGSLAPGMHLDQGTLAGALGYSTTPIREAVRWLSSEGLVSADAHRELRIAPLSSAELTQLYAVRLRLDPWAAALGVANADADDRDRVRRASAELQMPTPSLRLRANRELHQAMFEASKNEVLITTLNSLWDRSDRYRMILVKDDAESQVAYDEHLEIIDAFLEGDAEAMERLMYEHLLESSTRIMQLMREREAQADP